jgi:hypothetical protein
MGADLIVLNLLDVGHPAVDAIEVADATDVVRGSSGSPGGWSR